MSPGRTEPPEGRGPDRQGPDRQALIALAALGMLAFNFPLLAVWDSETTVFGVPLLPVALFAIWGALIAALAFASERRGHNAASPLLPAEPDEP
ncbi:hypothetical protein [Xanthobacter sp. 126]|uniref:hypothetical protein n=1 Tax=Xanthobacter sp. 126 TaxID=1131814 RepID=UPI00045EAA12|nr:hypothetical protein [Xanthobacter sp. 126]